MIITMKEDATREEIARVIEKIKALRFEPHIDTGSKLAVIGVRGDTSKLEADEFYQLPGVASVARVSKQYKEVSREFRSRDTVLNIGGHKVGGEHPPFIIAGPCTVETREQVMLTAAEVKSAGAVALRGGAYKPRSSPYSFQGLGEEGLKILAEARETFGMPIVTEIKEIGTLDLFAKYDIDVYQVGARNMQNYDLLQKLGQVGKPVLLKRGPANSIDEWLLSAEYIMANGNPQVILCERGILPPIGSKLRYTFDVGAIPVARELSHLPVIADPSHAAGRWNYVLPLARAALAAGAHGIIVEVHPNPTEALCDGPQALKPARFRGFMEEVRALYASSQA
ncbi:MAG: 3-deoxy-7-phosphoheptulonate synthase [Candidatus Tectomicrobia bacterium]|nr:3-deoxy-7-phosphoheptulonate synthase [Candidatus Tectomicrobia bacterium]